MDQENYETTQKLLEVNKYKLISDLSPVDLTHTRAWKKLHRIKHLKFLS